MAQKKSSNWYIAATHYLTAGFAIPFVIGLIVSLLIRAGASVFLAAPLLLIAFLLIIRVLAIWMGTKYSANYLKKAYIIENKDKIVNLAAIYFFILNLAYLFIQIGGGGLTEKISGTDIAYSFGEIIIAGFIFYIFSKKYVKNTEVTVSQ
jgi:hypothetical protein